MAAAPTYITHKELKRIFPQLDEFDQKTPIYGWSKMGSGNIYEANNTGLVTALFSDGRKLNSASSLSSSSNPDALATALDGEGDGDTTNFNTATLDDATGYNIGSVMAVGSEQMLITGKDSSTLTLRRGFNSTTITPHAIDAVTAMLSELSEEYNWIYDSGLDMLLLYSSTDPNDLLIEAGEDFNTMVTQYRADASRYFDSRVDPSLPKNQLKDKSGNYDYMVVRTVGLIAACFMMRTKEHSSPVAQSFMEEAERNIELLNEGKAALSWQNTADAAQGTIRDVSYTDGSVRPVDTRGEYSGTFDLIRVKIETGGAMDGTATYSVWVKDGDKLGNQQGNQVVTSEKINGDYQALAGGLQIRFGGESKTSVATATNEWEVEVTGRQEYVDSSDMKSVKLTRTGTPARRYYK
tara:strand:- start:15832 stop:17058 length:1227 start_codon:yes stop_codon:yes gene_type:complete